MVLISGRLVALIVLVAACSGSSSSVPRTAQPGKPGERAVLFRGVRVFDGQRATAARDVLVRGERIAEVSEKIDAPGAEVIDGRDRTLVPGLIDAHAHVWEAAQLERAAVFGVTTVLDMMTEPRMAAALKVQVATDAGRGLADLRSAGNPVTAPGGHGTEYGIPFRTLTTPADAQAFIDACIAEGSDYIKLVYDDAREYGASTPTISVETLAAAVAAAHARKRLAVVHIGSQAGARQAFEAGVDGLAHLFVDSSPTPEFAAIAARHHAFVVPTLSVNQSVAGPSSSPALIEDHALRPYLAVDDVSSLKRTFGFAAGGKLRYAFAEETVRQLHAAHVPILAGTDAPNPGTVHGASMHGELALLVRAGLTPSEALAAATSVVAEQFGLDDRGRIAAGLRADLLLVEGDPTADILALRRVVGVWVRGTRVDRAGYLARVGKQRVEAADHPSLPAPAGSQAGLVSDFDDGKPSAAFGSGWLVSTDAVAGGASTAEMKVVPSGAQGSKGALSISGEVVAGKAPAAWAGAMFAPGATVMAPANLSGKKRIAFWARGDGRTYALMLFSESRGRMPAFQTFDAGPAWKQYTFDLAQFDGLDGHDLTGLFFGAATRPGKFSFAIDRVEFR